MTSKERVLKVITGQEADRPPVFTTVTPQTAKKLSDRLAQLWFNYSDYR